MVIPEDRPLPDRLRKLQRISNEEPPIVSCWDSKLRNVRLDVSFVIGQVNSSVNEGVVCV